MQSKSYQINKFSCNLSFKLYFSHIINNLFPMQESSQKPKFSQRSLSKGKNLSPSASRVSRRSIPIDQLLQKLSFYPELDQLPTNGQIEHHDKLWRDSPCSVKFVNRHVSLDKVERFRIGSIYQKDELNSTKRVFTESHKSDLLLQNFRRQIEEASRSRNKKSHKSLSVIPGKLKKTLILQKLQPLTENKKHNILLQNKLKDQLNKFHLRINHEKKPDQIFKKSTHSGQSDIKINIKAPTSDKNQTQVSKLNTNLQIESTLKSKQKQILSKSDQSALKSTYRSRKDRLNLFLHQNAEKLPLIDGNSYLTTREKTKA